MGLIFGSTFLSLIFFRRILCYLNIVRMLYEGQHMTFCEVIIINLYPSYTLFDEITRTCEHLPTSPCTPESHAVRDAGVPDQTFKRLLTFFSQLLLSKKLIFIDKRKKKKLFQLFARRLKNADCLVFLKVKEKNKVAC